MSGQSLKGLRHGLEDGVEQAVAGPAAGSGHQTAVCQDTFRGGVGGFTDAFRHKGAAGACFWDDTGNGRCAKQCPHAAALPLDFACHIGTMGEAHVPGVSDHRWSSYSG
jgi:hypothetical protein